MAMVAGAEALNMAERVARMARGAGIEMALLNGTDEAAAWSADWVSQTSIVDDEIPSGEDASEGILVPLWASSLAAHSARLAHAAPLPSGQPEDGYRIIERWWMT